MMELKDYTDEQLKSELKRRTEKRKAEKANIPRCRNCKHCLGIPLSFRLATYKCAVRTYKWKGYNRNYLIKPYNKACEYYEKIE